MDFDLLYLDGMGFAGAEIGLFFRISGITVRARLSRLRKRLGIAA